jgi:septal ring factor EnvC (AmiA/AmiB activator)
MTRLVLLLTALVGVGLAVGRAQESPADILQRQADEERARRLTAKIADLEATAQSLQQQIDKLTESLGRLREEVARLSHSSATAALEARVKTLAAEIAEVDRKRLADYEKITAYLEREFARLAKAISAAPASRPPASSGPSAASPKPSPASTDGKVKLMEYTVQPGDTLSGLVVKLRKEGIKITQKQIEEANPGVDWQRLPVGRKILVPVPVP